MKNKLVTDLVVKSWHLTIDRANSLFESLSDEELKNEIAPSKNRGVYLLGHLAAINDMMLPLLDLGEQKFPELASTFVQTPDDPSNDEFTVKELREFWKASNVQLAKAFDNFSPEEWLQKHTSVSEEDFAKQPYRNKLSVLMSRTNHVSFHIGQLILMKNSSSLNA